VQALGWKGKWTVRAWLVESVEGGGGLVCRGGGW